MVLSHFCCSTLFHGIPCYPMVFCSVVIAITIILRCTIISRALIFAVPRHSRLHRAFGCYSMLLAPFFAVPWLTLMYFICVRCYSIVSYGALSFSTVFLRYSVIDRLCHWMWLNVFYRFVCYPMLFSGIPWYSSHTFRLSMMPLFYLLLWNSSLCAFNSMPSSMLFWIRMQFFVGMVCGKLLGHQRTNWAVDVLGSEI